MQAKMPEMEDVWFLESALVPAFLLAFAFANKSPNASWKTMLESRMHKCTYMSHCACMCIGCVLVFFVQTSPNYFVHEEKVILGKNQICVESILLCISSVLGHQTQIIEALTPFHQDKWIYNWGILLNFFSLAIVANKTFELLTQIPNHNLSARAHQEAAQWDQHKTAVKRNKISMHLNGIYRG